MPKFLSIKNPKAICLTYLVIGIAWIFFSDGATTYIFSDNILAMSRFQLYKGIFYVLVTSGMLYFLIKKLIDNINNRKQELELLFTNPNVGILKLDKAGLFTEVSDNILAITGYSTEELIGKSIAHYTPANRAAQDEAPLLAIAESKSDHGFIFKKYFLTKANTEIVILGYAIRIKSEKKRASEYIVAFQNITEQVRSLEALEANNRQLREIASEQSHLVRAPLARILGITKLLQDPTYLSPNEMLTLMQNLEVSAEELDLALRDISQKMNSKRSSY